MKGRKEEVSTKKRGLRGDGESNTATESVDGDRRGDSNVRTDVLTSAASRDRKCPGHGLAGPAGSSLGILDRDGLAAELLQATVGLVLLRTSRSTRQGSG
jgi:hypothetical protein